MRRPRHRLHPPFLSKEQQQNAAEEIAALGAARIARYPKIILMLIPGGPLQIALSSVYLAQNFDAFLDVGFPGLDRTSSLVVDSGNNVLVMPSFDDLANLPNFATDYDVIAWGHAEPFGCAANLVRGPIQLTTRSGASIVIPQCVFFACTGASPQTANFGVGCVDVPFTVNGTLIKSPLSYLPGYPFAEFSFTAAAPDPANPANPIVGDASNMTLYPQQPIGYQMMEIVKGMDWMALTPKSLKIGATLTCWPSVQVPAPIAMIDTGGGPVFLSDPDNVLNKTPWPDPVDNPCWVKKEGSIACKTTKQAITIELGDLTTSYTYSVDTSTLPPTVKNQILVACQTCSYMEGKNGMNIGGISLLFNLLLIDYANLRVGLKPN